MALIDDFIKKEESTMYLAKKWGTGYLKIRSTPELTDTFGHLRLGNENVIKPPFWVKAFIAIILLFTGCLWLGIAGALIDPGTRSFSKLFGLAVATLVIYFLVKNLLSKDPIIRVNYEGIRIDDKTFPWTAIDEVYTMEKMLGRRSFSYLLIVKKDAAMEKFDLSDFSISSDKLSTIIEYYRTVKRVS